MPTSERVQKLPALVGNRKFVEAIREFHAEDATMQEKAAVAGNKLGHPTGRQMEMYITY
jgi:hypothetical protein